MKQRIPSLDEFIITESVKENDFINESWNSGLIDMHFATSQSERDEIAQKLKKSSGWTTSDIDYMFKKMRKEINYQGPDMYDPESSSTYNSTYRKFETYYKPNKFRTPAAPIKKWDKASYNKWIKDMASGGGVDNAYDMAQNAKREPGLIDYVKKMIHQNYGDETPLERIQWDIENKS